MKSPFTLSSPPAFLFFHFDFTNFIFSSACVLIIASVFFLPRISKVKTGIILSVVSAFIAIKFIEYSTIQIMLCFFIPVLFGVMLDRTDKRLRRISEYSSELHFELEGGLNEIKKETEDSILRSESIGKQINIFKYLNSLSYKFGLCRYVSDVEIEILKGAKKILETNEVRIIETDYHNNDSSEEYAELLHNTRFPINKRINKDKYIIAAELISGLFFKHKKKIIAAVRDREWSNMELRLLFTLSEISGTAFEAAYFSEKIEIEATHDALTGVFSRRAFEKIVEKEISLSSRANRILSFAILDLDHFKKVNDTWGHKEGDNVLTKFGFAIKHYIDKAGTGRIEVGRYGGEEFTIIARNTDSKNLESELNMLREYISSAIIKPDKKSLTFSAGISEFPLHGNSMEKLYQNADKALYHAKASGRDNVRIFAL